MREFVGNFSNNDKKDFVVRSLAIIIAIPFFLIFGLLQQGVENGEALYQVRSTFVFDEP